MSTPVEPLRLLLLAEEPAWAALLRECLAPMGSSAVLISAPSWESVSSLFEDNRHAVLLTLHPFTPTEVKGYYNNVAHNAMLDGSSCPGCGIVPYIIGSLVSFMSSLH